MVRLYAKDSSGVSTLCYINDAGTEVCMPTSGSFVTGAGVANRLVFWSSATQLDDVPRTLTPGSVLFTGSDFFPQEDNANFFWDDSINRLGLGSIGLGHSSGSLLSLESTSDTKMEMASHGGNSNEIRFRISRGSHASPTVSSDNDTMMVLAGHGHDGTGYILSAWIQFAIDGTPGTNDMPGEINFYTTPDGSASAGLALSINNAGSVIVAKAAGNIDLTAISAGNPNLKITATSDTPTVTWTALGTFIATTAPAGYMEITVGGNSRYVPFWA